MNTKTQLLFFPYSQKSYPLLHMLSKSNDISNARVASYKGSGLVGKDIGFAINYPIEEGKIVENIFDIDLKDIRKLIVLDSNLEELNFDHIEKLIAQIKDSGGKVVILSNYINERLQINTGSKKDGIREFIFDIKKPVIFVAGIYDTVFNSIMSLEIKKGLLEKGVKTSILTFDANLTYLHCCSCKLSMFESMSLPNIVYYLKTKIQDLLNDDEVDAIIIQIPCGLVQSNEKHFNDFGIYYTLFSDIAAPDYIICNLPYDYYEEGTLIQLNDIIKYKTHNQSIDSILFNNYYMKTNDPISLSANDDIIFLPKTEFINNDIEHEEIKAIIKKSYSEIVDDIMEKLGG